MICVSAVFLDFLAVYVPMSCLVGLCVFNSLCLCFCLLLSKSVHVHVFVVCARAHPMCHRFAADRSRLSQHLGRQCFIYVTLPLDWHWGVAGDVLWSPDFRNIHYNHLIVWTIGQSSCGGHLQDPEDVIMIV